MSEERAVRTGEREENFGRVVLQTRRQEGLYSLDLYETHATYAPGLTCRGYYMRPIDSQFRPPVPVGVELSLDDEAFNAIYEMFGGGISGEGGPRNPDTPYSDTFVLGGPGADVNLVFSAEVSAPLRLPDRTVWTGWLGGRGTQFTGEWIDGQFDFILEQYGTIEPITLLLAYLFFVVFYERDGRQQAEECYQRALRLCGEGNIKSLNTTSGVTGMTLRVDRGCQIECFER